MIGSRSDSAIGGHKRDVASRAPPPSRAAPGYTDEELVRGLMHAGLPHVPGAARRDERDPMLSLVGGLNSVSFAPW